MARKPKIDPELIAAAEKAVRQTCDLREFRQAQAILLPGQFGLTLAEAARALGASRASLHRWRRAFRLRQAGALLPRALRGRPTASKSGTR